MASVTARATTLKGSGAGEYYVHELPNYYLDSGEPRGVWLGQGAETLGLSGEVRDAEFLNVMAGAHPHDPSLLLGRRFGEESVRGFDVTASAPKSVSVLKELAGPDVERHVAAAHDAAVASMAAWVEDHAHTRFRVNGEVVTVDAEGLVMATFRQHTSRALDPQLHTHLVIANRVQSPDGRWLALDARYLKKHQRGASAHYHLVLRNELTARLGVGWEPVVNGIAEISHLQVGLLEEFSSRTDHIERRLDVKVDRFVESMGREPTVREYWKLEREAVLDSRPAKVKDVSAVELRQLWAEQVRGIGHDPAGLVGLVADRATRRPMTSDVAVEVVDQAIVSLSEHSTWHPADLTREIAAAIPTDVVTPTNDIPAMLKRLTDYAIEHRCVDISRPTPDGVSVRRDGRPTSESGVEQALTTPEILAQDRATQAWAERRMSHLPTDSADAPQRSEVPLTIPQAEVAAAVAGDAHLTLIVGPAGTGKTTALKPAVEQLHAEGRAVFGVAPSAAAAEVVSRETGVDADTIDKLLTEHSLQRPPGHRYDLPAHATVIVDEAGMLNNDKLHQLTQLADSRSWRVVMVGDPMQFAAVGRGGMFEHLVDSFGAIELDRVHRFTELWEATASLRLRRGDPTVADVYQEHGRLHGGTRTRMQTEALDAWQQARCDGETVVLATPDNNTAQQLNVAAQQRRLDAGELSTRGRTINTGDYELRVGDEIVTRRNHRQLTTNQQQPVRNRDRWTIDSVHRNGDLTVTGDSGTIRLPSDYVQHHVELGYAQTSHATQGRTVDRSILYLDGPTDARGIYVPLTRGRHTNDVYIATTPDHDAHEVFAESINRLWVDQPAIAIQTQNTQINEPARPGTFPPHELRQLLDRAALIESDLTANTQTLRQLPPRISQLTSHVEDATKHQADLTSKLHKAEQLIARYDRPLRRRGHEQDITRARETINTAPDQINRHAVNIQGYERDITSAKAALQAARTFDQQTPALKTELADVTQRLDDDRNIRTRTLRRETSNRITSHLGQRPQNIDTAKAWDNAAGHYDQHQTAYQTQGIDTPAAKQLRGPGHTRSLEEANKASINLHYLTQQEGLSSQLRTPEIGISR